MIFGKVNIKWYVTLALLFCCISVRAQNNIDVSKIDSTYIIPNKDSLEQKYMVKDTTDNKFIESLERTVKKSKLTRWLSSSIFVRDKSFAKNDSIIKEDYSEYGGKIIRQVKVEGLSPYEVNAVYPDDDTHSWLTRLGDATHVNTRGFVLRNNLMIKDGDVFDNEMIINNLAYYRNLRYIYDARVVITPIQDSDYVDVEFIVRDVWSIGINHSRLDFNKINFEIYDRNILGMGSKLRTGIYYDRSDGSDYLGFGLSHSEGNIKGSFISSQFEIIDKKDKKLRHASLERNMLPNLKTAGGLSYQYLDERRYFITIDTTYQVKNETADIWFGKVFDVGTSKGRGHHRLAAMARYEYRKLRNEMPFPTEPLYDIYENRDLYLASVSLYKQQYYTDRLLYGFGINENIPYGYNITLQAGHESHRYGNRFYTSLSARLGKQHSWGYTYLGAATGGYLHGGKMKNGLLEVNMAYFSPLIPIKNQVYRQFTYISYTRGIKKGIGEGSFLNYAEDLSFDLTNEDRNYFGKNKLTISIESDFFSTVKLLGFRFVFFNFADMTWIGNRTSIFANDFLPGVGIGIRIRNDKLVFKTLQLKLGWYPKFPQGEFNDFFDASGVDKFMTNDFVPRKPQTLEFK
ncbi:MAG: hypothetical protein LBG19_08385 [Prevotellaceae bacterium]|nr:hypothetical protein [Prevotellaceae bacterium]